MGLEIFADRFGRRIKHRNLQVLVAQLGGLEPHQGVVIPERIADYKTGIRLVEALLQVVVSGGNVGTDGTFPISRGESDGEAGPQRLKPG